MLIVDNRQVERARRAAINKIHHVNVRLADDPNGVGGRFPQLAQVGSPTHLLPSKWTASVPAGASPHWHRCRHYTVAALYACTHRSVV